MMTVVCCLRLRVEIKFCCYTYTSTLLDNCIFIILFNDAALDIVSTIKDYLTIMICDEIWLRELVTGISGIVVPFLPTALIISQFHTTRFVSV